VGILAPLLLSPAAASAYVVGAPSFVAGPRITADGLLWEDSAAQLLTLPSGRTHVLVGGGIAILSNHTSSWIVAVGRKRIEAGRLAGKLLPVALLRRCPALAAASSVGGGGAADRLLALSGATLYSVVDLGCIRRHGHGGRALVAISLRTGRWRLLTGVPTSPIGLAASGPRIAVTSLEYGPERQSPEAHLTVVVLDANRGRRLYATSVAAESPSRASFTTQLDGQGDVLVTSSFFIPPAAKSSAWWATPSDPVAHRLSSLASDQEAAFAGESQLTGAAVLSAGRIAYLTAGTHGGVDEEQIALLDLRRRATRPVVVFPGLVGVLGLDLSGQKLAWAQQRSIFEGGSETTPSGGVFSSCQTVTLGPVQLTSVELARLAAKPLLVGPSVPATAPLCTAPRA
jgi:hypothetical protein